MALLVDTLYAYFTQVDTLGFLRVDTSRAVNGVEQTTVGGVIANTPVQDFVTLSSYARELLAAQTSNNGTLVQSQIVNRNLQGVNLSGTDLSFSNLSGSNFNYSVLQDTILRGANLTDTTFVRADLRGADLGETSGLTANQLAGALLDSETVLPLPVLTEIEEILS